MHNGWIKLHRRITQKGYYKKSSYVHLWLHLLLSANHDSKEFMWNEQIILIKEGQLITGRKQLSHETGISQSSIERILKLFESEHQIEQQKTTKYRLITILNWKSFQNEQQSGQQTDNRRTTDGQQTDTNKNDKNIKNIYTPQKFQKPTIQEIQLYCIERKNSVYPQKFLDHYESNGWRVGRTPMKDWKAAIRTWEKNSFDKPLKKPPPEKKYSAPPPEIKLTPEQEKEKREALAKLRQSMTIKT